MFPTLQKWRVRLLGDSTGSLVKAQSAPAQQDVAVVPPATGGTDAVVTDPREWLLSVNGRSLPKATKAGGGGLARIVLLLAFSPAIFGFLYYGLWATDRYVSEARYLVRTASRADLSSELGSLFKVAGALTGNSNAQGEIYTVQEYLTSREAITDLSKVIPLREVYADPSADYFFSYPSLLYGKSEEEFYRYMSNRLTVTTNQTTGLSTLRVEAPNAQNAHKIATAMLDLAEKKINELNERIRSDAISNAQGQLERAEKRVGEAQAAITAFRTREMLVDARQSSMVVVGALTALDAERVKMQTELRELERTSPTSPFIASLRERIRAVETQLSAEKGRISDPSSRVASNIAENERLGVELEFSRFAQKAAMGELEKARAEARRQQLYLLRIVSPNFPDYAIHPLRIRLILSIMAVNLVVVMVIWLFAAGIREHSAKA